MQELLSVLMEQQQCELSNVKTLDEMTSMNGCVNQSNLMNRCKIGLERCCMILMNQRMAN